MINLLIVDVFVAYNLTKDFSTLSNYFTSTFFVNFFWIFAQYCLKTLMVSSGSSATNEANRTVVIILKAIGAVDANDPLQKELSVFLKQLKGRNKNLENVFFIINWKLMLNVRSLDKRTNVLNFKLFFKSFLGDFNNRDLSYHCFSI